MQSALGFGALAGFSPLSLAYKQAADDRGNRMLLGRPSITALGAAMLRAAHQLLDEPRVFDDPLALAIVGTDSAAALHADPGRYASRASLRAFVALRSRYAEDQLAAAMSRGVRQYVVLGAGLDTFAYRSLHAASRLRVFEVDHPATQSWKRERLKAAGIALPDALTFAPVDFERQTLADGLRTAGLAFREPAFFSMLGVVVYLTKPALMQTLQFVASLPAGSEIVFDYGVPSSALSETQKAAREAGARLVAAAGEPWFTYFDPDELAEELRGLGLSRAEDLSPGTANERYFSKRADGLRIGGGGRVMRART